MRRALVAAVVVALVGLARPAAADTGTTKLLVRLDGPPSVAIDKVLGDLADAHVAPTSMQQYQSIPYAAIEVPAAKAGVVTSSDGVSSAVIDGKSRPSLDSTVPIVKADQASTVGYDGTGSNVAVIDTGVEKTHPFLTNKVVAEACFSNIAHDCPGSTGSSTASGSGAPCSFSDCDHGTHVAGIAAGLRTSGSTGPARGVASGAGIVALRVFTGDSSGAFAYDSDILAALDYVYTNRTTYKIAAANLSLGGSTLFGSTCTNTAYSTIFGNLAAAGVAPVVAAGNNGSSTSMTSPACVANAISVAATTDGDAFASFSNRNALTSLAAPGVNVTSSVPGGGFATFNGTSMAAPHVAGAFAILRQATPDATVANVLSTLKSTGVTIGSLTPRIDIRAALESLVPTTGPVRSLTLTPGDHTLNVSWSAPLFRTASADAYTVSVTGQAARTVPVGTTATSYTGLTNGTQLTVSVTAHSTAGDSVAATGTVTPASLPAAPTAVSATGANGKATVSWTAPSDTGGVTLTGYRVTTSPAHVGVVTTGGSTTQATVTGLTNGTGYTFTVQAVNASGTGAASPGATATPAATAPGAPTGVTAVAGNGSATVSWSAPADNGGSAVTGYRVTPSPAAGGAVDVGNVLSTTISSLSNGQAYTFTVQAMNALGVSSASGASSATTPVAPVSSGAGGGGGGGFSIATTTTTTTPSSTTTPPPAASPSPSPTTTSTTTPPVNFPTSPPSSSAVVVGGNVVLVKDGVPTSVATTAPNGTKVAAAAATPTGQGAWVVTPSGRVFASGDADNLGSISKPIAKPIVAMASTSTGDGYWLLGSDGGIFTFGDAKFFGSTGNKKLNKPVLGLSTTRTSKGYWLAASDGGIFTFGDAKFFGSTGALKLAKPIVSISPTGSGKGYWLVGSGGGVFAFGDASFLGGGAKGKTVKALAPTPSGKGYWLLTADGAAIPYGDAAR